MKTLIIDAVNEKIFLVIITSQNVYTNSYKNSKSNFDKLTILINEFLKKKSISLNEIKKIYVNRGPGSFAGIRASLSIVKGIHLTKRIDYYSFSFSFFIGETHESLKNWKNLPILCKKYKIKKNLIKPLY